MWQIVEEIILRLNLTKMPNKYTQLNVKNQTPLF